MSLLPFQPATGFKDDQEKHQDQESADGLLHHRIVQVNGNTRPDKRTDNRRYTDDQAFPEIEDFLLFKAGYTDKVLEKDGYPVGPVGYVGRKPEEHQQRKARHL